MSRRITLKCTFFFASKTKLFISFYTPDLRIKCTAKYCKHTHDKWNNRMHLAMLGVKGRGGGGALVKLRLVTRFFHHHPRAFDLNMKEKYITQNNCICPDFLTWFIFWATEGSGQTTLVFAWPPPPSPTPTPLPKNSLRCFISGYCFYFILFTGFSNIFQQILAKPDISKNLTDFFWA